MRSKIRQGKLNMPPSSVAEAVARLRTLEVEIKEIEGQVANMARLSLYPSAAEYEEWKAKAKPYPEPSHPEPVYSEPADPVPHRTKCYCGRWLGAQDPGFWCTTCIWKGYHLR